MAALTVGVWWLWLGSDTSYQIDPQTGIAEGPYAPAQIIACVLCLLVLAVGGAWLMPGWLVVPAMVIPFVAAWSIHAAARDPTGLWGVGAVMLTLGMTAGTVLVVMLTQLFRRRIAARDGGTNQ